jgi:hypothetical protein
LDIDRDENLIPDGDKEKWIQFCLDLLEKEGFAEGIDWNTQITSRLTLEEIIGALIYAEQKIKELEPLLAENEKLSHLIFERSKKRD